MYGLAPVGGEDITVSTAAIGPTASEVTGKVLMAIFAHRSGGAIHWNIHTTPVAAGGSGDFPEEVANKWVIYGHDNVKNFQMIKQTGVADATIAVQYYGQG